MIIKPTVGQVVWFWKDYEGYHNPQEQPEAALVAYVFNDRIVNLSVMDHNGNQRPVTSVELIQEGDAFPTAGGYFCTWMPYQISQAKKHGVELSPQEREQIVKEGFPESSTAPSEG